MKKIKINKLSLIYFSPTGGTQKVVREIAIGMNFQKSEQLNLIKRSNIKRQNFTNNDVVIIGVPVYSGRIPLTVINRLKKIRANNTKTILVVVYGNRHYNDALLELKNLVVDLGFFPIAAAAFIGHHSYSSDKYPIAVGRPNIDDLKIANNFGKQIMSYIKQKETQHRNAQLVDLPIVSQRESQHSEDSTNLNIRKLSSNFIKVPGTHPYRERSEKLKVKPKIDMDLCDFCGMCQKVCPVDAISIFEDRIDIDEDLCIYCHACVRKCPQKAMAIDDERIVGFAKGLHENCKQPKKLEIFL